MLNLHGVVVKQLFEDGVDAQNMEVKIDGNELKPGMYFVRVEYGKDYINREVLRKVIIRSSKN